MATDTEMRARLREAGVEVPQRGRLNEDLKAKYAGLAADADWDLPDDPDGMSVEPDEPVVIEPELPPRTQRSARKDRRRKPVGERLLGPRDRTPKAKAKPKRRVSVDHLISRTWEAAARFTAPLSLPMSRCLQVQSPVAGMILEEIVAGTVVDRALQPLARAEEKAEKVLALIGPPVLVLAIEQSMLLDPAQREMRQALLVPMLRESLRIWLQVAGPKVEAAAKRSAEYEEQFGMPIDAMIKLFFPPGPETTADHVAEQEREAEMAGAPA